MQKVASKTIQISQKSLEKGVVLLDMKEYRELQGRVELSDKEKSLQDYREGKYYGPFNTAKEAVSFLKQHRRGK